MHIKTQAGRRLAGAILVWLAAIGIACFMGFAEERLVRDMLDQELAAEAARSATGIGAVASMPGWTMDETLARSLVMRVMEDRRLYAVVIRADDRMLEGQRRGWRGLVPWDDEMTEETVQGMSIMRGPDGDEVGTVEVYLPTRLVAAQMEEVRHAIYARTALWVVFATAALLLFLAPASLLVFLADPRGKREGLPDLSGLDELVCHDVLHGAVFPAPLDRLQVLERSLEGGVYVRTRLFDRASGGLPLRFPDPLPLSELFERPRCLRAFALPVVLDLADLLGLLTLLCGLDLVVDCVPGEFQRLGALRQLSGEDVIWLHDRGLDSFPPALDRVEHRAERCPVVFCPLFVFRRLDLELASVLLGDLFDLRLEGLAVPLDPLQELPLLRTADL